MFELPFGCNPQIHQNLDQRHISHQGHWTKEAPHHQMGEFSPRQMDPIHGVLLGVQLGTSLNPDQWVYQGERDT